MDNEKSKTENVTAETLSTGGSLAKDDSQAGAVTENELTPMQAIKAYPAAIFWALMVSMCVVMVGYDTILIGNFFAYPTFQKKVDKLPPQTSLRIYVLMYTRFSMEHFILTSTSTKFRPHGKQV